MSLSSVRYISDTLPHDIEVKVREIFYDPKKSVVQRRRTVTREISRMEKESCADQALKDTSVPS